MTEYILDEFGIPLKTSNEPIKGVRKGGEILQKFSEDYGPISKYEELLKIQGSSKAYATFKKDYEWLESRLENIADYLYREFGVQKICMSAYFIELKQEDHNCLQMNFPYENTVLKYHSHGPNFAQYLTSTIGEGIKPFDQEDLTEIYFEKLLECIPEHQLRHLNWIEPKFISNYALDADPHLVLEMEFNIEGIKKENSGVYSDLFFENQERFPFFPFQPIFGGKHKETTIIILPEEELFDIEDFRNKIANRINANQEKINITKRYDFKIALEDLKHSIGFRTIREIRIKHTNPKEISERLARDFINTTQQGLRAAQKCAASDYVKGKNDAAIEEGLMKRILNSYKCPTYSNLTFATFGAPEDLYYFDTRLRRIMLKKFEDYKGKILKNEV